MAKKLSSFQAICQMAIFLLATFPRLVGAEVTNNVTKENPEVAGDGEEGANLFLLSVGVGDYQLDYFTASKHSDEDATAVFETLRKRSEGLFNKVEGKKLINADASKRNVRNGLDWLANNAKEKDLVVFFFACHFLNGDGDKSYLLTHETHPRGIEETSVNWDDLMEVFGRIPANILFLLEMGQSVTFADQIFPVNSPAPSRVADSTDAIRKLAKADSGVILMASSIGIEESVANNDWTHGAFTKSLLEALDGEADSSKDGLVDSRELDRFVSGRVRELTDGQQRPYTIWPSTFAPFPVARVK